MRRTGHYLVGVGVAIFSFEVELPTTEISGDLEPQPLSRIAVATEITRKVLLAATIIKADNL
jgi:hypothetical protein